MMSKKKNRKDDYVKTVQPEVFGNISIENDSNPHVETADLSMYDGMKKEIELLKEKLAANKIQGCAAGRGNPPHQHLGSKSKFFSFI